MRIISWYQNSTQLCICNVLNDTGYINTKCLCAAVDLNIPNILSSGPKALEELARASYARADRFRQIMHILYNDGISTYDITSETYPNNSTSAFLASDHWPQCHNWVDLYGNEFYDMAYGI